jgi:hypothetical protein
MSALAPVVLFVYNRPWHTLQTLEALQTNTLASESVLYIYADGAKDGASNEALQKIQEVRALIASKQWCKEVVIIESEQNKGLAKSIQSGVSKTIQKHGKAIVMEDDLITSSAFLTYMNKALARYESRKSVFSISAYNVPSSKMAIPNDYVYDVYVSLRNGSWGWATWSDRWSQVDWEVKAYQTVKNNQQMQGAFNRGGDDVYPMLQAQQSGELNIWSIQFTMAHFINHAVSIVPTLSYVDNVGLDGSGENCSASNSLRNSHLCMNENPRFLDVLYEDKHLINAFYSCNHNQKRPVWQKAINRLTRMLGRENIFVIKKKIYN